MSPCSLYVNMVGIASCDGWVWSAEVGGVRWPKLSCDLFHLFPPVCVSPTWLLLPLFSLIPVTLKIPHSTLYRQSISAFHPVPNDSHSTNNLINRNVTLHSNDSDLLHCRWKDAEVLQNLPLGIALCYNYFPEQYLPCLGHKDRTGAEMLSLSRRVIAGAILCWIPAFPASAGSFQAYRMASGWRRPGLFRLSHRSRQSVLSRLTRGLCRV